MEPGRCVLGIDVGGTAIKAVLCDAEAKQILARREKPSEVAKGAEKVATHIAEIYEEWQQEGRGITSCGIACAGSIDRRTGTVNTSPNFPGWKNEPLAALVRDRTKIATTLENDANAAAVGEWRFGAGRGCETMVLLTFGTGIGGGLVLEGRLYRGASGTGGELGHTTIAADGEQCPCGNYGCFERYCSATALRRQTGVPAEIVFGDRAKYATVLETFERNFCAGVTSVVNAFNPQRVVLGGAMSESLRGILPRLEARVKELAFPEAAEVLRLSIAELGTFAGAQGAAVLAAGLQ